MLRHTSLLVSLVLLLDRLPWPAEPAQGSRGGDDPKPLPIGSL